jgi:predicted transcriptional regulator
MATISDYFVQAQLSVAAYAKNLAPGMEMQTYIESLVEAGMSREQANEFANKYSVIDQFPDLLSGFSATIFQDLQGKLYFAI